MIIILRRSNISCRRIIKRFRYSHGPDHWSVQKKKVHAKDKALEHFDDFYNSVYGNVWSYIRVALLKPNNKHVAIVNNFGNVDETAKKLELLGAIDLKKLYEAHEENKKERDKRRVIVEQAIRESEENENEDEEVEVEVEDTRSNSPIKNILMQKKKENLQSILPKEYEIPEEILEEKKPLADNDNDFPKKKPLLDSVKMRPLEEDLKIAQIEENRIIKPGIGVSSSNLYEFIPATKLKGLEDYVLESDHYNYYAKAADFSVKIEKEFYLHFPEHLRVYTYEPDNDTQFPSPKRLLTDTLEYYLMDGGSILPVLALGLQPGDVVLDMCAAPGGKALAILQTLYPHLMVANEESKSRFRYMNRVMEEYLGDLSCWNKKLIITRQDARTIEDTNFYHKILVDVPCTTDRHVLHSDDNNLFKSSRIKERLQIPQLQTEILLQALKIVIPGGTVVYSTCTLSPIQNDGVVQMALKRYYEETGKNMIVKNLEDPLGPLNFLYKFANNDFGLRYGHIVLPTRKNNWGPMYFCKIVKPLELTDY